MKQLSNLICFFTLVSIAQLKAQPNKLSVEFNTNIATYSITEYIVAEHPGRLFYIDGKANFEYLPMADAARAEMHKHDNSKIIQQMLDYLKVCGEALCAAYLALWRKDNAV